MNLVHIEEVLWVITQPTGLGRYDFDFESYFPCRHPYRIEGPIRAVARMGAAEDYPARYAELASRGIELIHTPDQYELTSWLPRWYPLISDLTPRSVCYSRLPSLAEIESEFRWPIFVKGARQTSRHQRRLSILDGPSEFHELVDAWTADPILRWQPMVCREFVPLRPVGEQSKHVMPRAFEFRSFWWKGHCVGIGPYWQDDHYELTATERDDALAIAGEAARRLGVTFLVVDVAQAASGRWMVIECNDGQDSGYAGVQPMLLWRKVIDLVHSAT